MCTNLCACRDCLNIDVDENRIEDDENENEFEQLVFEDDDDVLASSDSFILQFDTRPYMVYKTQTLF
jgi:hypothetical protein